jgi:hypothetical protein
MEEIDITYTLIHVPDREALLAPADGPIGTRSLARPREVAK